MSNKIFTNNVFVIFVIFVILIIFASNCIQFDQILGVPVIHMLNPSTITNLTPTNKISIDDKFIDNI